MHLFYVVMSDPKEKGMQESYVRGEFWERIKRNSKTSVTSIR